VWCARVITCHAQDGIRNESADVRLWALRALERLLSEQQASVHGTLVLAEDKPHDAVKKLMEALLRRCRDANLTTRLALATVLSARVCLCVHG
jgi:HEAT repeat protein